MLIESFGQAILRWLRIPPGASVRHNSPGTSSHSEVEDNDYIQTILDITVDDICVGDAPLSIDFKKAGRAVTHKLEQICEEFNTVVKDVARDLCKDGYSVLDIEVDKDTNNLVVFPYIDPVEFYLTNKKKIVAYSVDEGEQLVNKLVFINYSKSSLIKVEDATVPSGLQEKVRFKVSPQPMQLKNAERTLTGITSAENAIAKYRQLLRPVRYANVDIGTAVGDTQKTTVDSIASSINCNSESLGNSTTLNVFDDNIPILPNRKGLGRVEISSDIPSANLKDLADLDYWLNKLNLVMRFPATYMDFSRALSESAVSMIRGDLRYVKLCKSVQTKITTTLNRFIQESKFGKYSPVFALTSLPSSEDDDVIQALANYCELAEAVENFVIGDPETPTQTRLHRLELLKDLFSTSTTSPAIQKWFDDFETFIVSTADESSEESSDEGFEPGGSDYEGFEPGGSDYEGFESGGSDELPDEYEDLPQAEQAEPEDVEIIPPQS